MVDLSCSSCGTMNGPEPKRLADWMIINIHLQVDFFQVKVNKLLKDDQWRFWESNSNVSNLNQNSQTSYNYVCRGLELNLLAQISISPFFTM